MPGPLLPVERRMPPRIPYCRVKNPRAAPYVIPPAHIALEKVIGRCKSAVVMGASERAGVTRTLFEFNAELPDRRRQGVVVDLSRDADLQLAEILVLLRNEVVKAVDRTVRLHNIEVHLFDFDVSWAIWKQLEYGSQDHHIEIYPSLFRRLTKAVIKKIFVMSTGGLFEALDLLDGVPNDVWNYSGDKASGAAVEVGSEIWFDRQGRRAATYFMTKIVPRINSRIRDAVDEDNFTAKDVALQMLPMLVQAIDEISLKLRGNQLAISVDAIDMLEGIEDEITRVRVAIGQLLYEGASLQLSTILAGRGPALAWLEELDGASFESVGPLGQISQDSIEHAWHARVDPSIIQAVVDYACGTQRATTVGRLADAWRLKAPEPARGTQ
jgi:hypothetical protein